MSLYWGFSGCVLCCCYLKAPPVVQFELWTSLDVEESEEQLLSALPWLCWPQMAAATLGFLTSTVTGGGTLSRISGFGQVFSNCFRPMGSSLPSINLPRSGQTVKKDQKQARDVSFTVGFGSVNPLLMHFSKVSRPPEASIDCFAAIP